MPEQNDDSVKLALVRALFTERVMRALKQDEYADDAYMVGMFSVFDSALDTALPRLLDMMHVAPRVKGALMRQKDVLGGILKLAQGYETGQWADVDAFTKKTGIAPEQLTALYRQAVAQAENAFQMAAD